ncbi:MAG: hypothetical protein M1820_007711 [Bogoriella megaspora]|nr:MAG: hypothetical protein M1820_007711 [Bogoriella megaspora]
MPGGRSLFEYTFYLLIVAFVYIAIGAPGLPQSYLSNPRAEDENITVPQETIDTLVYPDTSLQCPDHSFQIHIFSANPLIIYIENFVSLSEASHLIEQSESKWQLSTIFNGDEEVHNPAIRNSSKALIDRDTIVQCIEQRALSVQGWPRDTFIERLWTQKYGTGGHYSHHFDWGAAGKMARRVSTFMVYLAADCTGGGTNFPRLKKPEDGKWSLFLDDNEKDVNGVTFKAIAGNAVFWMNFDAGGKGYQETIHAGMPVKGGSKVGLNVWSWYQAGHQVQQQQEL